MFSCSSKLQGRANAKTRKRGRLFHATDFQSLMCPCFIFCRMLGIFPYKLNTSTSKLHYIISTIIICVSCIFYLLLFVHLSQYDFGGIIRSLGTINYYTINGFIVITTHVLNGPRRRLLQTILDISSHLSLETYQKMSRFIHIKDILGIIFQVAQMCISFSKILTFEMNYITVMFLMITIYFILLVFQVNMLYINCVCILKACFKRINDNLAQLMINDMKPSTPGLIYLTQKNQFLLIELKILKKQYLMISDTVQMLNIIFSLQLLATVVMTFSTITFEIYFHIFQWQDGVYFSLNKQLLDEFSTSMACKTLIIILLVWVCETGKNQAQEITITIHDLLNSTNNEQVKNELHLFSLQILHCKNTFSAKGITVDATLLATIVGNITTYLLILIQFLNMSHFCDGKTATNIR